MTPEQEILQDTLVAARKRATTFAHELARHARTLPLDPSADWTDPSDDLQIEMAAFTKRYEMTQDLITRRLFRSILAVQGKPLRSGAVALAVREMAAMGVVDDPDHWEELTKLRNSLTHDYMLTFAETVPLLNQAWRFAPDLLAMIVKVERFVANHRLLEENRP